MKKIIKYTLGVILLISGVFIVQNYPISSAPKNMPRLADTSNIRRNLAAIINTPKSRNYKNIAILDSIANYIRLEFLKSSDRVAIQQFGVSNQSYSNIIASFGPEDGERIIVGAHYDVCGDQDGADDNASGVAGLLELARLLNGNNLKYRVDLVAYALEEPPFFGTQQMGSYVHAKSLHDAKVRVKGMVSLEMIGYYSDEEGSQDYPVGFLKWFYGSKGNYITIVQKSIAGTFAKQFKELAFENNSILTKSFRAPSFFGGIDLSDHRNYWEFGYSALMVTNTSFYRNASYHQKGDVLQRLNIPNIGLVVDGVFRVLKAIK
ncbi:M28 family peptidase [Ferruginibacter sp. SUN106]|uniref:M28 family peptidase n=1 Tax=Ferruginibacter sp. SUN106 TaxID=2978348 RepID=UPI003D35EC79